MKYSDFRSHLLDTLTQELGAEVQLSVRDLSGPEISGTGQDACVISIPDRRLSPVFYPGYFYQKYTEGTSFEEIIENIKDSIRYTSEDSLDFEQIADYQRARHHIVPRLIRGSGIKAERDGGRVEVPYLDLTVIFTYVIRSEGDELVSFSISWDQMNEWGITVEKMLRDSIETAQRLFPSSIESIEDVLSLTGAPDMYRTFHVLTNCKRQYGAACILYDHVLGDFADRIGEGFYMIPSSVHEVLLLPESIGILPADMKEMLDDVNASVVKPEEVLSDRIYYYDRESRSLDFVV
ncbi:MAG: DUF5688 family protein [Lachnospiraceae bacterium]|nr:DUF5688 family protein [Lachnospiraceae bacterium]